MHSLVFVRGHASVVKKNTTSVAVTIVVKAKDTLEGLETV